MTQASLLFPLQNHLDAPASIDVSTMISTLHSFVSIKSNGNCLELWNVERERSNVILAQGSHIYSRRVFICRGTTQKVSILNKGPTSSANPRSAIGVLA